MPSIREKVSVRAVIIGSVSDIVGTNVWGVVLGIFLVSRYNLASMPQSQIGAEITATLRSEPLFAVNLLVGALFTIMGGYIASSIARRNEILNGALASFLCVSVGIFSLVTGSSGDPLWLQVFWLPVSVGLAMLGGLLKAKQRSGVQRRLSV